MPRGVETKERLRQAENEADREPFVLGRRYPGGPPLPSAGSLAGQVDGEITCDETEEVFEPVEISGLESWNYWDNAASRGGMYARKTRVVIKCIINEGTHSLFPDPAQGFPYHLYTHLSYYYSPYMINLSLRNLVREMQPKSNLNLQYWCIFWLRVFWGVIRRFY